MVSSHQPQHQQQQDAAATAAIKGGTPGGAGAGMVVKNRNRVSSGSITSSTTTSPSTTTPTARTSTSTATTSASGGSSELLIDVPTVALVEPTACMGSSIKSRLKDYSVTKLLDKTRSLQEDQSRLYGRSKEIDLLNQAFDNLVLEGRAAEDGDNNTNNSSKKKGLVLLDGLSGSGKTRLASTLQPKALKTKGFYCIGKSELDTSSSEPFAAIKQILSQLCCQILKQHIDGEDQSLRKELQESLSSEQVLTLSRLCPEIQQLVVESKEEEEEEGETNNNNTSAAPLLQSPITSRRNLMFGSNNNTGNSSSAASVKQIVAGSMRNLMKKHINNNSSTSTRKMQEQQQQKPEDPVSSSTSPTTPATTIATTNSNNDNKLQRQRGTTKKNLSSRAIKIEVNQHSGEQLVSATLDFLRCITNHVTTTESTGSTILVIVCDDIQWMDQASMEMIQSWLLDPFLCQGEAKGRLMIVASYRSNLVDEHHPFTAIVEQIKLVSVERSIDITEIHLGSGIDEQSTCTLLADVMGIDIDQDDNNKADEEHSSLQSLASLIYTRTLGNVFYIIQFLLSLAEETLLQFNIGRNQWCWDIEAIKVASRASDDVAVVMAKRISQSPDATAILPLAAHLGSTFTLEPICIVLANPDDNDDDDENGNGNAADNNEMHQIEPKLRQQIETCVRDGFLTRHDNNTYSFVHDRVQSSALDIIPPEKATDFAFHIGKTLLSTLGVDGLGGLVFAVANLLKQKALAVDDPSSPSLLSSEMQLEIFSVNLRAGIAAVEMAAFGAASEFFKTSIHLLSGLEQQQQQILIEPKLRNSLYSYASAVEYCLGNFDLLESYSAELLKNELTPTLDKAKMYSLRLEVANSINKFEDAVQFGRLGLSHAGISLPKQSLTLRAKANWNLNQTKRNPSKLIDALRQARHISDDDELNLVSCRTLQTLGTIGYLTGRMELVLVTSFMIVQKCIQVGLNPYAALAMAQIAMQFISDGDISNGKLYAEEALFLSRLFDDKWVECRILFYVGSVLPWSKPYRDGIQTYFEGYRVGMRGGDSHKGLCCAFTALFLELGNGDPLVSLANDMKKYLCQICDAGQKVNEWGLRPCLQGVANLVGDDDCKNTVELTGKFMNESDFYKQTDVGTVVLAVGTIMRIWLAAYFGEVEKGAAIALADDVKSSGLAGFPHYIVYQFVAGVCLFAAAGMKTTTKSRKKQCLRAAEKCYKTMKYWTSCGNPNCTGYLALLEAERAAVRCGKGKDDELTIIKKYEAAVVTFARLGRIHDQALANERLGQYQLFRSRVNRSDLADAQYRFGLARDLYSEWGATRRVKQLQKFIDGLQGGNNQ